MWTFEQRDIREKEWSESSQRFSSFTFAAQAATEWMIVNAMNDCIVEVRLKEIKTDNPTMKRIMG